MLNNFSYKIFRILFNKIIIKTITIIRLFARWFLFLSTSDASLSGTSDLLSLVLTFLALLTGHLLLLLGSVTDESVLGLELLGEVKGVVDQGEAS